MHAWLPQLQNKQDWARLFGYEVHQMAELVDGHMRTGPWQKAGLLRKVRLVSALYTEQPSTCSARAALCSHFVCQREHPKLFICIASCCQFSTILLEVACNGVCPGNVLWRCISLHHMHACMHA